MAPRLHKVPCVTDPGDRAKLARILTHLHDNPAVAEHIIKEELGVLKPRAHTVGVTGAPAAGKSTLTARLLTHLSREGRTAVVLAIDPTSDISGGALLVDRLRMSESYLDPHVFIRSLGSRGSAAGLTPALPEMIAAASMYADMVIVETVGAGQTDTDIRRLVETLVVVLAPLGDFLSIMKSGQTEHAHLVAVNTREGFPGNDRCVAAARAALDNDTIAGWQRRVFAVDALEERGIEEFLHDGIDAHGEFLKK